MVLKMNTSIQFCGEKRKFKRCPNKALRDYQRTIEEIQDEMIPLAERTRDFQFRYDETLGEIESIDKHIELLEKLESPTDEEIRKCIELTEDKLDLQKQLHSIRIENDEADLSDKEFMDKMNDRLKDAYCSFAILIFDKFTSDDFEEYVDSTDMVVAPRLGELYRLATSGAKQNEIDGAYRKIVEDSFR